MEETTVFVCEDTVNGIFTGVYDAWASRLGHHHVRLQTDEVHQMDLFASYRFVEPDEKKAGKVARAIRSRMGEEAYETIFRAVLARDERKADSIYRVLVYGLSGRISEREASQVIHQLTDPDVCRVFELARAVWHEAHHYMGFIRFRELENGILFAKIQATHHVLPLISEHFADRFPRESFMIWDHGDETCMVHEACGSWYLFLNAKRMVEAESVLRFSDQEKEMQQLWKGFCTSIGIEARTNRKLQQQLLPLRFRTWMTEMQE